MNANQRWEHGAMPLGAGLRLTARLRPDAIALVVVDADGDHFHTYADLDGRAARVARELAAQGGVAGDRALLLMDSGIDYVAAFYGCLYAGVIAVPAFPPEPARGQHVARLAGIASDADVTFMLTTSVPGARHATQYRPLAPNARIVAVDVLDDASGSASEPFEPFDAAPEHIAFLQYTSGSTGSPKGVMVTHGNLVANQQLLAGAWGTDSSDVYVSWLPLYHDMGLIGAMMQAFFTGMRLVLMSPQFFLAHPLRWLSAIERHRGTMTGAPDFAYRLCADYIRPATAAALDLSSLRVAYSGAEPVRHSTLEAFIARFEPAGFDRNAFFACYGLAEATLMVSGGRRGGGFVSTGLRSAPLGEGRAEPASPGEPAMVLVACGQTYDRHAVRIVDPYDGSAKARGIVGEIQVRGPSVCPGYWRKPDASADVLKDGDPCEPGPWLRTGDLGFMHDGLLYIAARRKDLIIVRGRNLYPQDIEQALEDACDFVRKGRVAAFDAEIDDREGPGVAAEIPPMIRRRLSAQQIVERLGRCIFDACGEAPSAIVLLNPGGLPKTSSGKVQRAATRAGWRARTLDAYAFWERGRFVQGEGQTPPDGEASAEGIGSSETARLLAACWRAVLGDAPAHRDAHFFASGGSSLGAAQLASAIGKQLGCALDMGLVFEFPDFSRMAAAVARLAREQAGQPARRDDHASPLVRSDALVVSHAQQRQLFAAKLDPGSTAYHIAMEVRLHGKIDRDALTASLAALVADHEALRTTFIEEDGAYVPHVHAEAATLEALDANEGDDADSVIRRFASAPFDLERGPLARFGLLTIGDDESSLILALHHIAADGWSLRILLDDWVAGYRTLVTGDAPPARDAGALRYRDYAAWQAHWLDGAQAAAQLAYWKKQLADAQPLVALPQERSRFGAASAREAERLGFALPADAFERLKRAANRSGTTPFMLMLAAWNAWLHRATGQADVCTGVPVANRRNESTHRIVGFFVNTLVARSRWTSRTSVASLVADLRRTMLDGLAHQDLPFDTLVERLDPERGADGMPWFRTTFNYLLDDYPSLQRLPALSASHREIHPAHAKVALALDVRESGGQALRGFLTFARDAFSSAGARRIVGQYLRVLDAIVAALLGDARGRDTTLANLSLLAPDEWAAVHRLSRGPAAPAGDAVHVRFAHHARTAPERLALVDGEVRLSYGQLNARASGVANWLAMHGVTAGQRVAVIAERSATFVTAMLGVLEAGGAYVPLDASAPRERIAQTLADCGAVCVLAERRSESIDGLPGAGIIGEIAQAAARPRAPGPLAATERPAYVIYTSGSTGTPKGVVVSHASLSNYVDSVLAMLRPPAGASFAMISTIAADLGHTTLFGALASGGTLHLIDRSTALDADRFANYMAAHRIDVLKIVPSHLGALLHAARPADALPRTALVLGGEASGWTLIERIRTLAPSCRVFNHYGPTETTVGIAMQDAAFASREAATLPVGRPLANQCVRILDTGMEPVAVGAVGELYLGGRGVAHGYLDRPGLTADRFVPDPFEPGGRLYRSGDRARWLEDGSIEYVGRSDDQLKIRGYRVEPGEIAARLRELDGVREAFVIATLEKRLAAFVTAHGGAGLDPRALRRQLARGLPDYMVPSLLLALDTLPLNPNGKVDRHALLALAREAGRNRTDAPGADAPRGDTERRLAAIWTDVLGDTCATGVRRGDNFFAIGGHSLAAMRALSRIRSAWHIDLPLRDVLAAPALCELAAAIDAQRATRGSPAAATAAIPAADRGGALALSPLQQRIWIVDQLAGGRLASYNMALGLSFDGALDPATLSASLARVVERHEVLRASFPSEDGVPSMRIGTDCAVSMPLLDASMTGIDAWRRDIETRLSDAAREPFDLATGPLMRACLVRFGARHHVLVLSLHHIVADGESIHILLRELAATYRALGDGRAADLPALPVQYADYAASERAAMTPQRVRDDQAFWHGYLDGVPHRLLLPADAPRPARASHAGDAMRGTLSARTGEGVRALAARHRTTPFAVLLASFQWFVHLASGQRDLVVGTDVADRHRPEFEGLVGFFVNVLPLRSTVPASCTAPPTFAAWLDASQRAVWQAFEHRALPFERIVEAAKAGRRRDGNPLVQVLFVLRSLPRGTAVMRDLRIDIVRAPTSQSKFDMALFVEPHDGGYDIEWVYSTALFSRDTVATWFDRWTAMLDDIVAGGTVLPWRAEWSAATAEA